MSISVDPESASRFLDHFDLNSKIFFNISGISFGKISGAFLSVVTVLFILFVFISILKTIHSLLRYYIKDNEIIKKDSMFNKSEYIDGGGSLKSFNLVSARRWNTFNTILRSVTEHYNSSLRTNIQFTIKNSIFGYFNIWDYILYGITAICIITVAGSFLLVCIMLNIPIAYLIGMVLFLLVNTLMKDYILSICYYMSDFTVQEMRVGDIIDVSGQRYYVSELGWSQVRVVPVYKEQADDEMVMIHKDFSVDPNDSTALRIVVDGNNKPYNCRAYSFHERDLEMASMSFYYSDIVKKFSIRAVADFYGDSNHFSSSMYRLKARDLLNIHQGSVMI
jgi:hypothetical protein